MKKPVPKTVQPYVYDELELPKMLTFAGVALRRKGVPVFRMEDRLVFAFRWESSSSDSDEDKLRRDDHSLMVDTMTGIKMHELLVEYVPFAKIDTTSGLSFPVAPPRTFSAQFMEAKQHWRFDVLNGLIQTPTLRADGSLLTTPGYDKASGLYLDTDGATFPPIKDKPTRADALAALKLLKEPFSEFPFMVDITDDFDEKSPDLSVALSAILTGLIRRTLPTAPLHAFDAPEAGSGKSLCCSVVTLIVTGNNATAITFGDSETEFRKLLFAALLANDAVIVFDNLTRPLEYPSLNSALTEATIGDRILGMSQNADVPTNALFMASGNNVQVKGDMHRRIIAARIEPGENPEERKFKRANLREWVKTNRPALVAAGLTILRAYHVAGYPDADKLTAFGGFEDWSRRIRGALVWLGEADPYTTKERFKEAEPEREALGEVIRALAPISKGQWLKCKAAIDDIGQATALDEALGLAAVPRDAVHLGKYLGKNKGRTVNGLRLEVAKDKKAKQLVFRVMKASA